MYTSFKKLVILFLVLIVHQTYGQNIKCFNPKFDTIKVKKVLLEKELMRDPLKYNGQWIETEGDCVFKQENPWIHPTNGLYRELHYTWFGLSLDSGMNCRSLNLFKDVKIRCLIRGRVNTNRSDSFPNAFIENIYYIEQLL